MPRWMSRGLLLVVFVTAGCASADRDVARGQAELQQHNYTAAEDDFREALWSKPGDQAAKDGLMQASAERRIAKLTTEIQANPSAEKYEERAFAYAAEKQPKKQIADIKEAIRLDPSDPSAYQQLASAFIKDGDQRAALATLREAVELDPADPFILNLYATILATSQSAQLRDGHKAVHYATRACELTSWNDPKMLRTLAAAYAADGKFDEAVKWESAAEDIVWKENSQIFDTSIAPAKIPGERLTMYRQHKPYIAERDSSAGL